MRQHAFHWMSGPWVAVWLGYYWLAEMGVPDCRVAPVGIGHHLISSSVPLVMRGLGQVQNGFWGLSEARYMM